MTAFMNTILHLEQNNAHKTTAPPSGEAKNCITVLITEQLNWDKCGKTASLSHSTLLTLQLEIFLYKLSDS